MPASTQDMPAPTQDMPIVENRAGNCLLAFVWPMLINTVAAHCLSPYQGACATWGQLKSFQPSPSPPNSKVLLVKAQELIVNFSSHFNHPCGTEFKKKGNSVLTKSHPSKHKCLPQGIALLSIPSFPIPVLVIHFLFTSQEFLPLSFPLYPKPGTNILYS